MNPRCSQRGGTAIGYLAELDSVEAASVIYLRLWSNGPNSRCDIWQDIATSLGAERADRALDAFGQLCGLCGRFGRRPLMRHAVECRCLGADEACFATFIAAAADGDRDDAMLMATLLVRPDIAPLITSLAADFGLALKQMNLTAPSKVTTTLH
ncbi:hypothetical protein [Yoonia sp. 2307UL14-13]|uniref:hypothetical protein n=1 Tax=Yoonia sp. 2307UL14-13 TaxID=3126506 RepID=UPI0030B3B5EA